MKKLKYILLGLPLAFLGSCSEDVGSEPGTDTNPVVTMYSYTPEIADGVNQDNDIIVRFATNSAVSELYYFVEAEEDFNSFIDANGSDAYMQKVIDQGVKVDVDGSDNIDKLITDQHGAVIVTGVAVNGSERSMATVSFTGLDWNTLCSGDFIPNNFGLPSKICNLEQCEQNKNLFRVKDAFKSGYSLKFTLMGLKGVDSDGIAFYPVRVPEFQTGYNLTDADGASAPLWGIDVAGWQEDSSLATDQDYWSIMYEDFYCMFNIAWYWGEDVIAYGSASDGQGNTSYFIPDGM